MVDVKTIIEESQEKMDMAVMYLEEALAHPRRKSKYTLAGWYPCRLLRKHGAHQQRSCRNHSRCTQHHD